MSLFAFFRPLFVLIVMLLPICSAAQIQITPQVGLGLATQGWRIEGETWREYIDPSQEERAMIRPVIAFEIGAKLRYGINDQLGLSAGLFIQRRGGTLTYIDEDRDYSRKRTIRLSYFAIPLGLTFTPSDSPLGLQLEGGFIIGQAIGGRFIETIAYDGDVDQDKERIEFDDDDGSYLFRRSIAIRPGDFRLYGGASIHPEYLPLRVGVRAELGLSNNWSDLDYRMANHSLTVFVGFPIKMGE
jgi:hypothetical protein